MKSFLIKLFLINTALFFVISLIFSSNEVVAAEDYHNSVFFGMSGNRNLSVGHNEFSIMAGYDRHIEATPELSVGVLVEGVFSSHSYLVLGVPVGFYFVENMKFWAAPCFVYAGGGKTYSNVDEIEYFKTKNQFMFKFGTGYSFHFANPRFTALPFVEGSVIHTEFILGLGVKLNMFFN
ncbi:hypothetical protein SDC9_122907 [bioreactor metagenome]|uniref:Outer membrane protein beta-barrel domain-containing protein n=1 Tax=bioreactor metagenome TaxID=1076179 RepID=A0A645CGD8_9ZZZZ